MRWTINKTQDDLMKKTLKICLLLIVIVAALMIAAHFVSFDFISRKLHGG